MTTKSARQQHKDCCESTAARDGQCGLAAPPRPRFILSGTFYQKNHDRDIKLCDYIVFWVDGSSEAVVVAELKAGHVPVDAAEQLSNGAAVAGKLSTDCTPNFAAVLVTNRSPHPLDRKVLARKRVTFQGKEYAIKTVRCGSHVTTIIPNAGGT